MRKRVSGFKQQILKYTQTNLAIILSTSIKNIKLTKILEKLANMYNIYRLYIQSVTLCLYT
jgi:hypothetical protein